MATTTPTRKARFDWHPTPEEVEAIVFEMRPLIAALADRELARLRAA